MKMSYKKTPSGKKRREFRIGCRADDYVYLLNNDFAFEMRISAIFL